MKERTQLPYIWSAGVLLKDLFKRLFHSMRINELEIVRLKEQIQDKNVVYFPASKTILDQLIVWYICLRYHLPVPAIICDEGKIHTHVLIFLLILYSLGITWAYLGYISYLRCLFC